MLIHVQTGVSLGDPITALRSMEHLNLRVAYTQVRFDRDRVIYAIQRAGWCVVDCLRQHGVCAAFIGKPGTYDNFVQPIKMVRSIGVEIGIVVLASLADPVTRDSKCNVAYFGCEQALAAFVLLR